MNNSAHNICIIIRVYNRVEDLKYCVAIIRDTWKLNNYVIIVTFNGAGSGYRIDQETLDKIDLCINIEENIGHFSGNSQLLQAGLNHIPNYCTHTIILEADTWIYSDVLVSKYLEKMEKKGAVWASAQFFRYVLNLATDFAIIKTDYLVQHPQLFSFQRTPEFYIAKYLTLNQGKFLYINEAMPINLPRYIKRYFYAPTGRFFTFLNAKMVTHHIETLKGGMEEKKFDFNVAVGYKYFNVDSWCPIGVARVGITLAVMLSYLIPYKGWLFKK